MQRLRRMRPIDLAAVVWLVALLVSLVPAAVIMTALHIDFPQGDIVRFVPLWCCMAVAFIPAAIAYFASARRAR